jgi:hypothetical protein
MVPAGCNWSDRVQTVTVKSIALGIRRPHEDLQHVINRVRNWAKEGLLTPIGDKSPGTGRSLQYPQSAIGVARALSVLADIIGLPASSSKSMGRFMVNAKSVFADRPQYRFLVVGFEDGEGQNFALCKTNAELLNELTSFGQSAYVVIDLKNYFDQLAEGRD